jgi:hypothetical protein
MFPKNVDAEHRGHKARDSPASGPEPEPWKPRTPNAEGNANQVYRATAALIITSVISAERGAVQVDCWVVPGEECILQF